MGSFNEILHISLNENQLPDFRSIQNIVYYRTLKQLDIAENPVATEGGIDIKKEITIKFTLTTNPYLRKINDDEVTEDDLKDAITEKEERIKTEELAR